MADSEDILTNDLGSVSLALPMIPENEYVLTVKKVEVVANPEKQTKNVKIHLVTTEDCKAVTGEPIKAGFPIFDNISLVPSDTYPQENINRRLKTFRVACLGLDAENGAFAPVEQYNGSHVKAKVKIQPASGGFEERNAIARYVTPKKIS